MRMNGEENRVAFLALIMWYGSLVLKKEKRRLIWPPWGDVAAVTQENRVGRAGGHEGDACVRQVTKDRVGGGEKQEGDLEEVFSLLSCPCFSATGLL